MVVLNLIWFFIEYATLAGGFEISPFGVSFTTSQVALKTG